MRHAYVFVLIIACVLVFELCLIQTVEHLRNEKNNDAIYLKKMAHSFGLSDLAISTEARYTRHLALTDRGAPFMDHVGSLEHFPSGIFYCPPQD